MSTPPSVDAMKAMRRLSRSTTMPRYISRGHVEALLDVEPADLLPLGAGLVRDELHAEDLLGELARFCGAALRDLHAAALAATACVDLRLDDDDRAAGLGREPLRRGLCLVDREGRVSLGDGNAVLREDLLALILVDLHERDPTRNARGRRSEGRPGSGADLDGRRALDGRARLGPRGAHGRVAHGDARDHSAAVDDRRRPFVTSST